ncbi:MAG: hypothetical protein FWE74_00255 [Oscillospiraceae bacterium]|nr:hypothetical protein [Oscillospiraceae bacterium]
MNNKYTELRARHKRLVYHDFKIYEGKIVFHFSIDEFHFKPEWTVMPPVTIPPLISGNIDLLVFNLGMAELISYWKCACPPIVEVRCGALSDWQIAWWKKLYMNGLGEFFYRNNIEIDDDFMQIHATGTELPAPESRKLSGNLIPIGGGKDSVVTLELLKSRKEANTCYIAGSIGSALDCAKTAGYADSQVINVSRTIDPALLELNKRGYLNGHTPFSSIIAFSSLIFTYLAGKKYIVLSNESSANEGNVTNNSGVNHQYSKSIEFERDFREYVSQTGMNLPEYFSLLRPWSEWQITKRFSVLPQYLSVFKSCNVGSKTNTWCAKCAKCLYVYIMLSAFLDEEKLLPVFGRNLMLDPELAPILEALKNPDYDKPFECVGTREEVNLALNKNRGNPTPLDNYFDKINFVPKEFLRLLV